MQERDSSIRPTRRGARRRRTFAEAVAVALAGTVLSGLAASAAHATGRTLRVLTWSDYLEPSIVAEFERDQDVELSFEYYVADDERDRRMAGRGGTGLDLLLVNGEQIERYAERGWLEPIDPERVPNRSLVDARWADAYPAAERYGVAYFWGTLGIAWRADLWPAGFPTWRSLLDPDPGLAGRIGMSGDGRELIGIALKAQGDSANAAEADRIRAAGRSLAAQRPFVSAYGYAGLDAAHPLVTGEQVAATMYNGDALALAGLEPEIRFGLPAEGGLLWVDYWTIAAGSADKALAAAFVDFLNRPDIAARNAAGLSYLSPLSAARALAGEGAMTGPTLNPGADELERTDTLRTLPPRARKVVNTVAAYLLIAP